MSNIELRNFPIKLDYFVEEYDYLYKVQVGFETIDRDAGTPMKLFIFYNYFKEDYSLAEAIRSALKAALAHEIDECLYQDSIRIFDPHLSE